MKRLIKFWGNYSDKCEFSNCSTFYEVLPYVAEDTEGNERLIELTLSNGMEVEAIETVETKHRSHGITLTHALRLKERKLQDRVYIRSKEEPRVVYLGFVTIPASEALPVHSSVDKRVTSDQAYNVINLQECSVAYTCELDGKYTLVKEGWDHYHAFAMLGYSIESFRKAAGIESETFDDEVASCGECGAHMWETDGYNYNYRIVDECTILGIECGCYAEHSRKNYLNKVNKPDQCIELDTAEELAEQGKLEHIVRYIGGMVDPGRGGYFAGKRVENGQPKEVLAELLKRESDGEFLFTHDESGQFQTYFSVWRVIGKRKAGEK